MALTEEEKNAKWAEKDHELKNDIKNAYILKQREIKRSYERTVGEEKKAAERAESAKNPITGKLLWTEVKEKVEQLRAAAGYQEWQNIQNEIVASAKILNRAMRDDPIEFSNFIPFNEEIGGVFLQITDTIGDKLSQNFINRMLVADEELPSVGFTVSMNEQNQLNLQPLIDGKARFDNPIDQELLNSLKPKLEAKFDTWAAIKGYEPDNTQGKRYRDEAGNFLTQNELLNSEADPETSFLKFAISQFEMPLTQSMSPM